jgi:phosphate transport system substrate-binding protein
VTVVSSAEPDPETASLVHLPFTHGAGSGHLRCLRSVSSKTDDKSGETEVMLTSIRRSAAVGALAIALGGALVGCGGDDGSTTGSGAGDNGLSGTVAGGGSSAQETAQEAWRAGFGQANPDVTLSYDAVGSGTGRENFISGAYKYAGTDSAMSADEISAATKACGGDPIQVPVFISPVDVVFNLEGVDSLDLDAKTVGAIFAGDISTWNDPAIADQNPDVDLPSTDIAPVHRSDSSGTTDNFTDYLYQASNGSWTTEHSSDWPTTKGESAEGTSGVIGAIQGGNGTIGYADDSAVQGTDLGVVSLKVGDQYVAPSAEGASAGLAASELASGTPETVMQYNIDRTTTDPSTYPLFLASYEVACPSYDDQATGDIVKGFLSYMISEEGQKAAAANAFSAPLPAAVATKAQAIVDRIGS